MQQQEQLCYLLKHGNISLNTLHSLVEKLGERGQAKSCGLAELCQASSSLWPHTQPFHSPTSPHRDGLSPGAARPLPCRAIRADLTQRGCSARRGSGWVHSAKTHKESNF